MGIIEETVNDLLRSGEGGEAGRRGNSLQSWNLNSLACVVVFL